MKPHFKVLQEISLQFELGAYSEKGSSSFLSAQAMASSCILENGFALLEWQS